MYATENEKQQEALFGDTRKTNSLPFLFTFCQKKLYFLI